MSCEWAVVGLVLMMYCLQQAVTEVTCPITTPLQVPTDASNVCLDVNLCINQTITFVGTRCPAADRISTRFYVDQGPYVNPEFDARFGSKGNYRYQGNNYGASQWGDPDIFDKPMELGPNQDFVMDFAVRGDTSIEALFVFMPSIFPFENSTSSLLMWRIDDTTIGTYEMRDDVKVAAIKRVCLTGCATISTVKLSSIE